MPRKPIYPEKPDDQSPLPLRRERGRAEVIGLPRPQIARQRYHWTSSDSPSSLRRGRGLGGEGERAGSAETLRVEQGKRSPGSPTVCFGSKSDRRRRIA